MRRLISLPYRIACTIIAVVALSWRAADLFGASNGLVTFGFAIAPWLALAALVLCAIGLIASRPIGAQLMLFACIMLASPFGGQLLPKQTTDDSKSTATKLRVMSFNAWLDRNQIESGRAAQVAALILNEKPDIVVLQEISSANLDVVVEKLQQLYGGEPISVRASSNPSFAVLSRFSLTDAEDISTPTRGLRVIAQTPDGPIQVWSVHAFRENLLGGQNFLAYRDETQHRALLDQTVWLANRVNQSADPMLIAGDLNAPTGSPAHRHLSTVMQDVQSEAGAGLGFTFPASTSHVRYVTLGPAVIPVRAPVRLTRIDHMFASPQFAVLAARVLDEAAGSDHAPVIADVQLR